MVRRIEKKESHKIILNFPLVFFFLGWRIKREVNLKTDSAIWLLGRCYHNKLNGILCFQFLFSDP